MISKKRKSRFKNRLLKFHCLSILVIAGATMFSACSNTEQPSVKQTGADAISENVGSQLETQTQTQTQSGAPDYIKKLQWVKDAKVESDLEKALSEGDYSFWVLASRITIAPGLDQTKHAPLLQKCGQKYLPGMGDVIFDPQHDALHDKAMKYAVAYNKQLIEHCKNL